MKRILMAFGVAGILMSSYAYAADTGWSAITELKAYPTQLLITVNSAHSCGGTAGNTKYRIEQSADAQVRLALAAFMSGREVQVDYSCAGSGQPAGAYVNIIVTQ